MPDQISVSVGVSAKVRNPQNMYEASDFHRNISRTVTIQPAPEDPDKVEDYEKYVDSLINNLGARLKVTVEEQINSDIAEFQLENAPANEEQ